MVHALITKAVIIECQVVEAWARCPNMPEQEGFEYVCFLLILSGSGESWGKTSVPENFSVWNLTLEGIFAQNGQLVQQMIL